MTDMNIAVRRLNKLAKLYANDNYYIAEGKLLFPW